MIEGRWIIPACWIWVCAGEIADVISGGTPSTSDPSNFTKDGIPWLTPADLSNYKSTYIERGARDISEKGLKTSSARILPKGTVLFTSRAPIGYCAIAANEISTNQGFKSLILSGSISPEFVRYYLLSAKAYAESLASGSTFKELSGKRVESLEIPLPPLNEQRRIVAKIEALRARSQWVKEAIAAIPPLLDQFRQSVLAAAFRGDLTADWREKNPDVEPASVLLEQIREKRKKRTEGKSKKSTDFGLPETKIEQLPEIPDSWHWIYFGELITSIRSGSTAVPQDRVSDYPILRSSSVRPGSVDFEDIRYLTKDQSLNEDNFLCEGDVLFTRLSGSLDYVANCAVVRDLKDQYIQYPDRIFRAKLIDTKYSNYSELCFASPLLRTLITGNAKSSAGHQRISMGAITEAPIPLPPLLEQQEIVRRVHSLWKTTNQLEANYQEAEAHIDQLNQSILAKAFCGELVPQDPNDEPASMLLERIKAERGKREAEAKAAKNTDKTSGRRSRKAQQPDSNSTQLNLPGLE